MSQDLIARIEALEAKLEAYTPTEPNTEDIVYRLRKRAEIRRQIPSRKSVQNGEKDRLSDLLEEAATHIEELRTDHLK